MNHELLVTTLYCVVLWDANHLGSVGGAGMCKVYSLSLFTNSHYVRIVGVCLEDGHPASPWCMYLVQMVGEDLKHSATSYLASSHGESRTVPPQMVNFRNAW